MMIMRDERDVPYHFPLVCFFVFVFLSFFLFPKMHCMDGYGEEDR